jgi:hypothetical protein
VAAAFGPGAFIADLFAPVRLAPRPLPVMEATRAGLKPPYGDRWFKSLLARSGEIGCWRCASSRTAIEETAHGVFDLHGSRFRRGDLGFGHQVKFVITMSPQLNQRYYLTLYKLSRPCHSSNHLLYGSYRRRFLEKYFFCAFRRSAVTSGSRPLSGRMITGEVDPASAPGTGSSGARRTRQRALFSQKIWAATLPPFAFANK